MHLIASALFLLGYGAHMVKALRTPIGRPSAAKLPASS